MADQKGKNEKMNPVA